MSRKLQQAVVDRSKTNDNLVYSKEELDSMISWSGATFNTLGQVKLSYSISLDPDEGDGVIGRYWDASNPNDPANNRILVRRATASSTGVVRPGNNLEVDFKGVLSLKSSIEVNSISFKDDTSNKGIFIRLETAGQDNTFTLGKSDLNTLIQGKSIRLSAESVSASGNSFTFNGSEVLTKSTIGWKDVIESSNNNSGVISTDKSVLDINNQVIWKLSNNGLNSKFHSTSTSSLSFDLSLSRNEAKIGSYLNGIFNGLLVTYTSTSIQGRPLEVPEPEEDGHAVTKRYSDSLINELGISVELGSPESIETSDQETILNPEYYGTKFDFSKLTKSTSGIVRLDSISVKSRSSKDYSIKLGLFSVEESEYNLISMSDSWTPQQDGIFQYTFRETYVDLEKSYLIGFLDGESEGEIEDLVAADFEVSDTFNSGLGVSIRSIDPGLEFDDHYILKCTLRITDISSIQVKNEKVALLNKENNFKSEVTVINSKGEQISVNQIADAVNTNDYRLVEYEFPVELIDSQEGKFFLSASTVGNFNPKDKDARITQIIMPNGEITIPNSVIYHPDDPPKYIEVHLVNLDSGGFDKNTYHNGQLVDNSNHILLITNKMRLM